MLRVRRSPERNGHPRRRNNQEQIVSGENLKINDLRDIWPIIRKRKWLIVIPWVLISAIVIVGSFFLTPIYQAATIIQVDKEVALSSELQYMLGLARGREDESQRRQQLQGYYNQLTSTYYIAQLAQRLKLDQDPDLSARAAKAAAGQPGTTTDQLKVFMLQGDLSQSIGVNYVGQNQIQIAVEHPSPVRARDVANTLGEIFMEDKLKEELSQIRSSQDFSDVQLTKYEKALEEKIREKTDYERQALRNALDSGVAGEINRMAIQAELDRTQQDINDGQNREQALLTQLRAVDGLTAAKLSLEDSETNRLAKNELKDQLSTLGDLTLKYPFSGPQVLNNRLRQNSLQTEITAENRRLVNVQFAEQPESVRQNLAELFTLRGELDHSYTKKTYLKAALDEIREKANRVPEFQATLARFDREIQAATDLRDKFKKQQETSTISQALIQDVSSSKYKVVEPAKIPMAPSKPNKIQIWAIGLVLGLLVGFAAVVLVELLDSSFRRVEDVQEVIGLPVLSVTPKVEFLEKFKKQLA